MDNAEICQEIRDMKVDVKTNTSNIAEILGILKGLTTVNEIVPMLIRWVIFPLVSILAAGYGIERVLA